MDQTLAVYLKAKSEFVVEDILKSNLLFKPPKTKAFFVS